MTNIIQTALFALFCLFSQAGMGMESIFEMQRGLDFTGPKKSIYYGAINSGSKVDYNEPPLENFLPVGDSAETSLRLIEPFPKEIWQQIWYFFDDQFKFNLSLTSKKFYQTIGQSMHLHAYELKLMRILNENRDENTYRRFNHEIHDFDKLFICTTKLDALSREAHLSEVKNRSTSLITAHEEDARDLLSKFKNEMGDLSKNQAYEEQFIYLCEMYNKDYIPKNCCERLGSSCVDCSRKAGSCITWPCTQCAYACGRINAKDYYLCLIGTGVCACSPCILLCSPCICCFLYQIVSNFRF